MSRTRPRCRVCQTYLRDDGACPRRCDPALAQPHLRTRPVKVDPPKPERLLTCEEVRDGLERVDVRYRIERAAARVRGRRGWRTRRS